MTLRWLGMRLGHSRLGPRGLPQPAHARRVVSQREANGGIHPSVLHSLAARAVRVELVPTSAPDFFTTDTPTAVLVRQVLGAISQIEKASLVAKLRAAREHKKAAGGRGSGRFTYAMKVPEVVALVRELHGQRQSLRQISKTLAAQGHLTGGGKPYTATAVQKMLRGAGGADRISARDNLLGQKEPAKCLRNSNDAF